MLQPARSPHLHQAHHHQQHALRSDAGASVGFRRKGILLIDDDDSFCRLMKAVGESRGVPLTAVAALEDLPSLGSLGEYDLVIVDYNLAAFTGLEIAEYVDAFFGDLPVMMVSIENLENGSCARWPSSIRRFVNKAFGPFAIVQRALKLLEEGAPDQGVSVPRRAGGFAARMH